jgi:hypothetical protein
VPCLAFLRRRLPVLPDVICFCRASAETRFNSATSARNAAQRELDDMQKLWSSTRATAEKSLES